MQVTIGEPKSGRGKLGTLMRGCMYGGGNGESHLISEKQ